MSNVDPWEFRECQSPWRRNPHQLISLIDFMQHFTPSSFFSLLSLIKRYSDSFSRVEPTNLLRDDAPEDSFADLKQCVKVLSEDCVKFDLTSCAPILDRFQRILHNGSCTYAEAHEALRDIHGRIKDEMLSHVFLFIPQSDLTFLNSRKDLIDTVFKKFPSTIYDYEEAAKCYAFQRSTACVYHLMRVMEAGIKALGKNLNLSNQNPGWEAVLIKCDKQLEMPLDKRSQDWKVHDKFLSSATAHLRAVKNAWRNPTMHVGDKYTEEEAREIFHAVRGFMRHLAIKLDEHGVIS